jgi:hypothetical protein
VVEAEDGVVATTEEARAVAREIDIKGGVFFK